MKKIIYLVIAIIIAAGIDQLPFHGTDVEELHPVEVLYIEKKDEQYEISTDTSVVGKGITIGQAVADLHSTTPGSIFLETANYLLLSPGVDVLPEAYWEFLRPACLIYICDEKPELGTIAKFLATHLSKVTLLDWRNGEENIPRLMLEGETVRLYES